MASCEYHHAKRNHPDKGYHLNYFQMVHHGLHLLVDDRLVFLRD
jgi:hypothetical protein